MNFQKRFSETELERIKKAVREAESRISGEIVPVIVEKSGYYSIANYKAGIVAAALMFLSIIVFDRYVPAYAVYDPMLIFVMVVMAGIAGAVAAHFSDTIKRTLISQRHMDHATRQRAENAFLEEEVFNTRHRTGIMIFISFLEHEVIVMADRGISKVVEQRIWDNMVNDLTTKLRNGKFVEGVEEAIKHCGDVLLDKGFSKTSDDVNELRDDLRIN
jgi:putative membrane protein